MLLVFSFDNKNDYLHETTIIIKQFFETRIKRDIFCQIKTIKNKIIKKKLVKDPVGDLIYAYYKIHLFILYDVKSFIKKIFER